MLRRAWDASDWQTTVRGATAGDLDNEQRAIKLVHQTKQVDELEDRVILYLVNDEVTDVQPSRQRHLVDHLVKPG